MRQCLLVFALLASSCIFTSAYGQAIPENPPISDQDVAGEILVVGNNSSFKLKGKHLENMVEAFGKNAPQFAPSARLMFQVVPEDGQDLEDISLSLKIDDTFVDIIVDENNLFALPVIPAKTKNVALIANRSKKAIKIMPLVYSAAYTPYERRLGDLRLECRVLWAGFKSTVSVFAQGIFGLAGGCASSKIGFYFRTPKPLKSMLVNGKDFVTGGAISRNGKGYRPPIYDKKIDNEAKLTLTPTE